MYLKTDTNIALIKHSPWNKGLKTEIRAVNQKLRWFGDRNLKFSYLHGIGRHFAPSTLNQKLGRASKRQNVPRSRQNPTRLPSRSLIFRVRELNKLSAVWLFRRSVPASQFPCRPLIKLRAPKFFQYNENVFRKKCLKKKKVLQSNRKEMSLKVVVKLDFGKCRLIIINVCGDAVLLREPKSATFGHVIKNSMQRRRHELWANPWSCVLTRAFSSCRESWRHCVLIR